MAHGIVPAPITGENSMEVGIYTPRRPKYYVACFTGIESIYNVIEVANTANFALIQKDNELTLSIAGLALKFRDQIVRAPDGSLSVMSNTELREKFEVLK